MSKSTNHSRTKFTMGRILISLGLVIKILQVSAAQFEVSWADNTVLSVIMLCAFAGGLAVFSYERRSVASIFALAAAVFSLLTIAMQDVILGTGSVGIVMPLSYIGVFVAYGLMLIFLRHMPRKAMGVLIIITALLLTGQIAGWFAFSAVVLMTMLLAQYLMMIIGLYL